MRDSHGDRLERVDSRWVASSTWAPEVRQASGGTRRAQMNSSRPSAALDHPAFG